MENNRLRVVAARNVGGVTLLRAVELELKVRNSNRFRTYTTKALLQLARVRERETLADPDNELQSAVFGTRNAYHTGNLLLRILVLVDGDPLVTVGVATDDLDARLGAALDHKNEREDDGDDKTHLDGEAQSDDERANHLQEVGPSSGLVVEDDLVRSLSEDYGQLPTH